MSRSVYTFRHLIPSLLFRSFSLYLYDIATKMDPDQMLSSGSALFDADTHILVEILKKQKNQENQVILVH